MNEKHDILNKGMQSVVNWICCVIFGSVIHLLNQSCCIISVVISLVAVYEIYPTPVLPIWLQGPEAIVGSSVQDTQCTAGSPVWYAATWIRTDVSQFNFYVQMFGQL